MFFAGLLMQSDNLRGFCRVDGLDLVFGLDPFAADDQVVFAAQLATNLLDRGAHLARILRLGEVGERLIYEGAFMQASLWAGRSFNGCHDCTSKIFDAGGEMKDCSL